MSVDIDRRPTVASTRVHPDQSPVDIGARVRMLTGTYPEGLVMQIKGAPGREQYRVRCWEENIWAGRLEFEVIG